jgi:hypothetical protein
LDTVRSQTSYPAARWFFGLPFLLVGSFSIVIGLIGIAVSLTSSDEGRALALWGAGIAVISGLFLLGISALGSAIFDMADAAIRADARACHREARESYEAYRASQSMQP